MPINFPLATLTATFSPLRRLFLLAAVVPTLCAPLTAQVLTPPELHQRSVDAHTLPEDSNKALKVLLALPPVTQSSAQFAGNATVILATPGNAFMMVRETDCSLSAFNAMYVLNAKNTTYTDQSRTFRYEQTIHTAAGLTTSADQFKTGCADPSVGIRSNNLIYIGTTPSKVRVGALAVYVGSASPQRNQLFTFVTKEDGTVVGTFTQPDPAGAGAGSFPVAISSGDLNRDGINDMVALNTGTTTTNGLPDGIVSITVYLGKTDGTFSVGQTYKIPGAAAKSVLVDDFNGDGIPDIVIPTGTTPSSTITSTITFLPGKGDGTFGAARTQTVAGSGPVVTGSAGDGLVSGDFNGDGKKDMVSGLGIVFLGNGDGTFAEQTTRAFPTIQTNSSASPGLAVGDFNKDGKLDLAAGSGDQIYVYLGNGNGTFTLSRVYASIDNHGYLTATDLDGDGNLDLYSGDATNGILGGDDFSPGEGYALMGNGDGSFRGAPQTSALSTGALVDLNGDGKLDYVGRVSTGIVNTGLRPFLGNGDGSFREGTILPLSFTLNGQPARLQTVESYGLADVNGDGKLDLIVQALVNDFASPTYPRFPGYLILLGNGDGTFQTPTFSQFPSLLTGGGQDYLYTIAGLTTATRADGRSEVVYAFLTQDFNGQNLYYQGYATQLVKGDGTLGAPVISNSSSTSAQPNLVLQGASNVVDLTGDKTPDLIEFVPAVFGSGGVVVSPSSYKVYVGKADGTFGTAIATSIVDNPNGYNPVSVADVNNDGKMDLIAPGLAANRTNGLVGVALGNGDGTFQTPKKILLATSPGTVAVGDFDGDGKADLVLAGFLPPFDSGLFPGNGDGTFQSVDSGRGDGSVAAPQPIGIYAYGPHFAADLNGDGKLDVAGPTVLISQYGITVPAKSPSTAALTSSSTAITAGQSVTLTATVAAASGSIVPTGTVTFLDGTTALSTSTLNAQGVATLSTTALVAGTHTLSVSYASDATFAASLSNTVQVTVTAAPVKITTTTTLAASPTALTLGQSTTLSATVAGAGGTTAPTGSVTFLNGTTTLGSGTLNASGVATLNVTTLPPGASSLTAAYAGDTGFGTSVSARAAVTVTVNTTATLATSAATITASQTLTFTATISASAGGGTPAGSVTFLDGTVTLGSGTLNAGGAATLTTATLAVGSHAVTARYAASGNFNGSASAAVTVLVTAQPTSDFTLGLSATAISVASGSQAQVAITVAPAGGFSQAVTFGCSGLPQYASCGFSPASLTPAAASATTTLTLTTSTSTARLQSPDAGSTDILFAGLTFAGLLGIVAARRRRSLRLAPLLLVLCGATLFVSGCGNDSPPAFKTPVGTYAVTVTATSGTISHSSNLGLTVQ